MISSNERTLLRELAKRYAEVAALPVQAERQARVVLDLLLPDDQALARAARQQGNLGVNAEDFQNRFRVGKQRRRHEHQAQPDLWRPQLPAQLLRPPLQAGLVEAACPMGRH